MKLMLTERHKARIAWMAGCGCTLPEICEDIGTSDSGTVKLFLDQNYIELRTGPRGMRILPVRIPGKHMDILRGLAGELDIVGADRCRVAAQQLLGAVIEEKIVARNLLGIESEG